MHFVETQHRSQRLTSNSRRVIVESTRSQYHARGKADWQEERPEATIHRVLLALLFKQTRKPFQLLKQFFLFS